MSKFYACIDSRKMPVYLGLSVVPVVLPGANMSLHSYQIRNTPIQALSVQGTEFNLSHVEPATMLGRVVDIETFRQPPGLLRRKHSVERGQAMGIQIVQDQAYLDGVGVTFVKHAFDPPCPIFSRSMLAGRHMTFARQWFHLEKDFSNAVADVFMVHPRRSARSTSHRLMNITNELFARFIHADYWILMVVWQFIHSNNIFHISYERSTFFWRYFPVLPEMRFKFVFLSMRCTVIGDTLAAMLNSIAFSASNRIVQRCLPSGAFEQANAIRRASKAPSKIISRGGFSRSLRCNVAANPSSTNRFFKCSIIRGVTPIASDIFSTFQAGPSGPASHR